MSGRVHAPPSFQFQLTGQVGVLTFNRPDVLNALTFETYRGLQQLLLELEHGPQLGCLVITGEGEGFCSGGDVHALISELLKQSVPELLEFSRMTCDVVRSLRRLRKPVIAAVNGFAAGAGAAIALACDLRMASERAQMAFLFSKVGLAGADMGAAYLLPKVVGLGRATELLYFGNSIDAQTGFQWGLFNRVVPHAKLLEETLTWAQRLAHGPTFALGLTKELLNEEMGSDLQSALDNEARAQVLCLASADFREGYAAFVEKRPPAFKGK